jgi:tetratricopeptide (TPR) repeat protein
VSPLPVLALLLAAQPLPARGGPRPQYDLRSYLTTAAYYARLDRAAAVREIRQWSPAEIEGALAALRRRANRLRAVPAHPDDIEFRTVEAAVLLHAEAGLLALQGLDLEGAALQLRTSLALFGWTRTAAVEARNWAAARRRSLGTTSGPDIRESIVPRDFHVALAAATLAVGSPDTAWPFAEWARADSPLDAEVQLVAGCVAASLADAEALRHRSGEADRAREDAEKAFRDALALEPGSQEARLRLGKLLLDEGRATEAEPLLEGVAAAKGDERRRYLARLFLGRLAETRGRHEDAGGFYRQALADWPDAQAARLGLARSLERSAGPEAARILVGASLAASRRFDRPEDPWWPYEFGPPGLAKAALDRLWQGALGWTLGR